MRISLDKLSGLGKGSYVIVFHLKKGRTLRIGKLGTFLFPRGYVAYVGSAFGPGGLSSRIRHHLGRSAKHHWHVDYLEGGTPKEAWVSEQRDRREHDWASILGQWDAARIPAPGFGCSDCKCRTHLFAFKKPPSFSAFSSSVQQAFPKDQAIKRVALVPEARLQRGQRINEKSSDR